MAHDKIEERLDGISQEDLDVAQEKLNRLCDEHNMDRITLNHGKSRWRELCYRMIGLPHNEAEKAGRSALLEQGKKDDMYTYMDITDEFPLIDSENNETYEKMSVDEKINLYAKKNFDKKESRAFELKKRLTTYWKNFGRKRLKEIQAEIKHSQLEEDGVDWPKEYYDNFYKNQKK